MIMVELAEIQAAYYMVAATGVLVAAAYYVMNVRAQKKTQELTLKSQEQTLETRQAQLFMQLYDRWTFDVAEKFWDFLDDDFKTAEELFEKERTDKEFRKSTAILSRYHEGLGVLVRFGLLDIKYIAYLASWPTRVYWEKYKPIIGDIRRLQKAPRADSESEYLYNELMKYMKEHPELAT
jgi:hypothetical protein